MGIYRYAMPFLQVYRFTVYGCVRSWILLLHIFIRLVGSNDFVDLGGESGDDVLRNVPYNIVVDSHVVVDQFVAHASHFAPGNTPPRVFHVGRYFLGSLSDDSQASSHCTLERFVTKELLHLHVVGDNGADVEAFVVDVLQVWYI